MSSRQATRERDGESDDARALTRAHRAEVPITELSGTRRIDNGPGRMLAGYAREKEVERRALMTRLRHLWAAMDHPDGKKGLAFAPFGETIVLFRGLSPKQATCVLLLLGSAFWMGTALGLDIFFLLFDVDAEAKQRVMHARAGPEWQPCIFSSWWRARASSSPASGRGPTRREPCVPPQCRRDPGPGPGVHVRRGLALARETRRSSSLVFHTSTRNSRLSCELSM